MATKIMHGRREGEERICGDKHLLLPRIGFMAKGISPQQIAIIQPRDWQRIHNSLTKYNHQIELRQAKQQEREDLHKSSKERVKNWGNTIEGQRLKKLQAKKLREEREEEERKKIDIEEAKLQAEKRKEAIEHAKQQLYYQTDRIKDFHGALLLTEVLKERDAQIAMKASKKDWMKEHEKYLLQLQQQNFEAAVKDDFARAQARLEDAKSVAEFQICQLKDSKQKETCEILLDKEEGQKIKKEVESFQEGQHVMAAQKRQDKEHLLETYKQDILNKQEIRKQETEKELENEAKIAKFVNAKRKMARLRKEKEQELFNAFQERTEKMCTKLEEQLRQKVDDEDERIAQAVEERERKRLEAEKEKRQAQLATLEAIRNHRMDMMNDAKENLLRGEENDKALLLERIMADKEFAKKIEIEKKERRLMAGDLQQYHKDQIANRVQEIQKEREKQLQHDERMVEQHLKDEAQFQQYACQVINDAKAGGRNPYPLIKAAREGPGGGRGPKSDGNAGLRPSFIVSDATGVQLPHYLRDQMLFDRVYGHVQKSGRRLGFGW